MEEMQLWNTVPGLCIDAPTLEYYPAKEKRSDAAIVIFPGGGYHGRAPHEGKGYAEFLNSLGLDAFVVQYRCREHKFPLPLLDARRGIRYVRHFAEKYGIDPNKIAVMGSSAGGHLAALASTYFEPIDLENTDEVDGESCIPNASILCYPVINISDLSITHIGSLQNLLEPHISQAPSLDPALIVSDKTPEAFIWHTSNDAAVNVINSYRYAEALRRQNIRTEMHIFPEGRHGLGIATDHPHVAQWCELLKNWLIYLGFLK